MKKIINRLSQPFTRVSGLICLIAVLILAAVPEKISAAEKKGYVYTIINNEATITGFEGEPTYIEIPETVEGCRVTELRDNAFYECSSLKHIVLPNSLEKIGHHAFYGCSSLESIVIPDSVTEIGIGSFCGCQSLASAILPDNLPRLPESCFRSCTSLRSITIPRNTEEIGDFCFSGCTSLSAVSLSDSTKILGDCAFYMCSSMKGLYIPDSVQLMGLCSVGYVPTNNGAQTLEGFTILGEKKSAAQEYAAENKLSFENASDSVHAFAIQRITGQRIGIPGIYLAGGAVFILTAAFLLSRRKTLRKKK